MKTVFLSIFFLSICTAQSQSSLDKAKAYYFQAEEQFENGNAQKTLDYLDTTEKLIGNTNGSIEALRVKAYYKTKQFENAQISLTNFYKYKDSASGELLKEMSVYLVKIEDGKKREKEKLLKKERDIIKKKENLIQEEKLNRVNREKELNDKARNYSHPSRFGNKYLIQLYNEKYGDEYLLAIVNSYLWNSKHKMILGKSSLTSDRKAAEYYNIFISKFNNNFKWWNKMSYEKFYQYTIKVNTGFNNNFLIDLAKAYYRVGFINKSFNIINTINKHTEYYKYDQFFEHKLFYWKAMISMDLEKCSVFNENYVKLSKKARRNKKLKSFNKNCNSK